MNYSVTDAARVVGKSRATIIRAIAAGTLSASRSDPGKPWLIDAAELSRAFPVLFHEPIADPISELPRTADDRLVNRDTAALIAAHEATIADLRRRLDVATQQLGEALQQVRLLTDQRSTATAAPVAPSPAPRRSWWPWRR